MKRSNELPGIRDPGLENVSRETLLRFVPIPYPLIRGAESRSGNANSARAVFAIFTKKRHPISRGTEGGIGEPEFGIPGRERFT